MHAGAAKEAVYDIIIIGGGVTGAGAARDAALRGFSVLLLEKEDFSAGVSSKTTRLVHGGLRYLATFELDLVAEALRERSILRRQAPYLITPMPILIPIYKEDPHGRAAISVGIHLYDLLSREKDIPHYFTSGAVETLGFEPRLKREGLAGSALFYDHQMLLPERLVFENVLAAREAGADVRNHIRAEKIEETGDGIVVSTVDALSGGRQKFRSRVLINAAGPWVDVVRRAGGIEGRKILNPTKGIHLVLPRLSEQALFVTSRDGRMFFIIPFGPHSLIGTTDTKFGGDLDDVHADADDVEYLLSESKRVLPGLDLSKRHILYTYAGVRPLAFAGERESKISRKHRVVREGSAGRIITIAGGKYTTYRAMAEDVVDAAAKSLGKRVRSTSAVKPLPGSLPTGLDDYLKTTVPELSSRSGLSAETIRHLIGLYGARAGTVVQYAGTDPQLRARISPESLDITAQILYSIRDEGAKTLSDIMLRRMHIGITASRGEGEAAAIAAVAGKELGWSADETAARIAQFKQELGKEKSF